MSSLKLLIRFCEDKPMKIILDFILNPSGAKPDNVVVFKATAQGGA